MNKTFVVLGGYHGSGSGAAIDLLREYKQFYYNNAEMRLICDPYGIKPLERALIDDWDWISSSGAIIDFLNLAKICSRSGGGKNLFARAGLNYSKKINENFMRITEDYIGKLTEFNWYRDFYYHKFKMSYPMFVFNRIRFAIEFYSKGKIKAANRSTKNYFSHPSREEFYSATKWYFDELYSNNSESDESEYIIMDLALAPRDGKRIYNYFNKAKMIVVDRDPRDILANLLKQGRYVDDWKKEDAGHRFSAWQLEMRKKLPVDENILYINFEDIILHTDKIRNKISDFLGVSLDEPSWPHKFLKPEVSAHNIGYWKEYYKDYQKTFDVISDEMKNYLYTEQK